MLEWTRAFTSGQTKLHFDDWMDEQEDEAVIERIREKTNATTDTYVKSTSDERTVNNTMRSSYRVLNDDEKQAVDDIKVMGTVFVEYLENLGGSRENSIARTKMEEAVMWAVRGITQ